MKKLSLTVIMCLITMSAVCISSCAKSEFGTADDITEKSLTIQAVKASKGDFFMIGQLQVKAGERIVISPALEKGSVMLEFIGADGMDDPETAPDPDSIPPTASADISGSDITELDVPEGGYMVKATVTEKATGEIQVEVLSAENAEKTSDTVE